jgi:pimeloyl-ACP methyl ester carboxylesterase
MSVGPATIYYEVGGRGFPLVLLHGLSGSARWWDKNVDVLAEHFRLYIVDLLGFGRGRGQRFSLRESSDAINRWLEQEKLDQVSLMGHSMGGFISADFSIRYPGRVSRLVLVDALVTRIGSNYFIQGLNLAWAARYMAPDFLPVLVKDALRAGPRTMARALWEIQAVDLSTELDRLRSPVLIVWGEYDKLMPIEHGRRLAQLLPDARCEVIKGAGHNPMWDRPAAFNQVVLDFLTQEL